MARFHLAQVNIGRFRAPIDSPIMEGFRRQLDPINALADASPGFVWRLQTEDGNATAIRPYPDDDLMAINMSVWESLEALQQFVYNRGTHSRALVASRGTAPHGRRCTRTVAIPPEARADTVRLHLPDLVFRAGRAGGARGGAGRRLLRLGFARSPSRGVNNGAVDRARGTRPDRSMQ